MAMGGLVANIFEASLDTHYLILKTKLRKNRNK